MSENSGFLFLANKYLHKFNKKRNCVYLIMYDGLNNLNYNIKGFYQRHFIATQMKFFKCLSIHVHLYRCKMYLAPVNLHDSLNKIVGF
jgi:hypothetical protein